jgi:hypothetical protein
LPLADSLGKFWLVITFCLRVFIIERDRGCDIWVLAAFWGILLVLAISPFNWIDRVVDEVPQKVGRMVSKEATHVCTVEGQCDPNEDVDTITGPTKK